MNLFYFHQKSFLHKSLTKRGFSILEVVVTTGILSVLFVTISHHHKKIVDVGYLTTRSIQANFLLEEGMEAVKSLRDESWSLKIAGLSIGTPYYLYWSGTKWTSTTTPQMIENTFTRTFTVASTTRDVNYDIVQSGGTNDPGTRKVTIKVSWNALLSGELTLVKVDGYIMNIFSN